MVDVFHTMIPLTSFCSGKFGSSEMRLCAHSSPRFVRFARSSHRVLPQKAHPMVSEWGCRSDLRMRARYGRLGALHIEGREGTGCRMPLRGVAECLIEGAVYVLLGVRAGGFGAAYLRRRIADDCTKRSAAASVAQLRRSV